MLKTNLFHMFLHSTLLCNISEGSPIIGQSVVLVENDEFKKDFAFMGSLGEFSKRGVHKKFERHYCGGVLISKRHVLTAAHCLKTNYFNGSMVTFGSTDLNRGSSYELSSWITYKAWAIEHGEPFRNEYMYDDVAMITLSSDVNGIEPAVISKLNDRNIFGQKVIAVGWGLVGKNRDLRPRKMQKAYLHVLSPADCDAKLSRIYGPLVTAQPNQYCTHAIPPVVLGCGDSGGPLILDSTKEIIGINSAVCDVKNPHQNRNAVTLHVKTAYYEKFINNILDSNKITNVTSKKTNL